MDQNFSSSNTESAPKHAAFQEPKKHSGKKVGLIILGVLFGLIALAWLGGAILFKFIAMPNTKLGTEDISLKPFSEVSANAASRLPSYEATVTSNDFSLAFKGSDIDLSLDEDTYTQGLAEQQSDWLWPLHILGEHTIESPSGISLDETKLGELISTAVAAHNETATQPTDATIGYLAESDTIGVIPEQLGTAIDAAATTSYVEGKIALGETAIALDDSCLVQPAIKQDNANLIKAAESANTCVSANITLTLNGMDAGSISKEQIFDCIVIDENQNASLDSEKLTTWAKENVADRFNTADSERTYTRPDGKVVTVGENPLHPGNYYGWVIDTDSLVSQLTEAIQSGATTTIDIPASQSAAQVPDEGGRDWGNRYIDCDLTEQHVRMYDDSGALIWETDCVTGKVSDDHSTPIGVYMINNYKTSGDVELRGTIDPATGEPEYISHVSYWMPFIDNSWAFHDATWRSSFGGDIYYYNGSHGCVNLPYSKAQELYNLCQIGDVVVVHY